MRGSGPKIRTWWCAAFARGLTVLTLALVSIFTATFASAATNSGITYHGRIIRPDGTALQGANVQFRMQIRSPGNENCLLYEEQQSLNMAASNGVFSITINDGSGQRTDNTGYSFDSIFANRFTYTLPVGACSSGNTYGPNSADGRRFVIFFRDENMTNWEPLPAQAVNFAPMAIDAKQIAGFGPNNLLRVDDTAALSNTTPLTSAQLTNFLGLVNGTSTQYVKSTAGAGAGIPVVSGSPSSPAAGSIWFDSTTNQMKYFDGTTTQTVGSGGGGGGGSVTSITAGTGLSGGTITTSGTISMPNVGTAGTYTKVTTDAQGRVSAGTTLAESDIPNLVTAGKVSGSAINSGTIGGSTAINTTGNITAANVSATSLTGQSLRIFEATNTHKVTVTAPGALAADYGLVLPLALPGSNGQLLTSDMSGNLSWSAPASGTVTSVTAGTGLSGGTFTTSGTISMPNVGTAGTYFKVTTDAQGRVSSGTNPTTLSGFGITDGVSNAGGAPSVQEGVDASKGAAGSAGRIYVATDTFKIYRDNGTSWDVVGQASGAPTGSASGDLSGSYPGPTVAKLQGVAVSATGPTNGQFMKYGGTSWGGASINIGDLKSSVSGNLFPAGGCSANQTLAYSAVSDSFSCASVGSLAWSAITSGLPTTLAGYGITDGVSNAGGAPSVQEGADSAKGAASTAGRIYVATDTFKIYRDNGSTWDLLSPGSSATVSSVGLSAPSIFTVSGSPVTTTGTLGLSLASETANTFLAAPNGSSGTPTFRTIASADLPAIPLTSGVSGILPVANGGTGTSNGSITGTGALTFAAGGSNQNVTLTPTGTGATVLNGNVGVGTSSPSQAMEVKGATPNLLVNDSGAGSASSGGNLVLAQSQGSVTIGNQRLGGIYFNGDNNVGATDSGAAIDAISEGGWGATGWSIARLAFYTSGGGTPLVERMRIDSSGNIGVGTTSPQRRLQVSGGNILIDNNQAIQAYDNAASIYDIYLPGGDNSTTFLSLGNGLNFDSKNYAKTLIRVTEAGKVGIGTTSPGVSLDVGSKTDAIALPKGTTAQEPASPVAGWIRYNTSNNAVEFYNGSTWTTLAASGGSYYSTSGGTISGNMTITPSSGTALTVTSGGETISAGGLNVTGGITANSGSITGVGSNITGSSAMTLAAGGTAQNLTLSSSTSGSVNVGSGNGTSLSVLDGGASTVDYVTVTGSAAGGSPTIATAGTDANINLTITPKGTGSTLFSSGKVGIGVASPASALDVNGAISISGLNAISFASSNTSVVVGPGANTTGGYGVVIGQGASGGYGTLNGQNTIVGSQAGYDLSDGSANVAMGYYAMQLATVATDNVAIGNAALQGKSFGTVGNNNTALGFYALSQTTSTAAANNVGVGYQAGMDVTTGANNIFIGAYPTTSVGVTSGSNNILLGNDVRPPSRTASNQLNIGNLIYATGLTTGTTASTGMVGLGGNSAPAYALDVTGDINASTWLRVGGVSVLRSLNGGQAQLRGATAKGIEFVVNGSTSAAVFDQNGLLGLGTTTPLVSLDLASKTDAIALPKGTTAQEPASPVAGWIRYNTSNSAVEFYNGSAWTTLSTGGAGSYVSSSGGTMSGALTISAGGETISAGGLNVTGGIAANAGSITGVGANITGSSAMTVAAGGTAQNLTLSSSTSGSVNVGSGNGTSLSVLDGGASTVDYVTVKGSGAGGSPTIATAGSDANINLTITPKGTGNTVISSGNLGIGTASPSAGVHVKGTTASNPVSMFLENAATGSSANSVFYISSANGNPYAVFQDGTNWSIGVDHADSNKFKIGTAATAGPGNGDLITVTTGGSVGIGTASPNATLDVVAPATGAAGSFARLGPSDLGDMIAIGNATSTAGRMSPIIGAKSNNSQYSGLSFLGQTSADNAVAGPAVIAFNSALGSGDAITGATSALTNRPLVSFANAGTSVMSIWPNGGIGIGGTGYSYVSGSYPTIPANGAIIQGNVGIGTSTPSGSLDVEQTTTSTASTSIISGRSVVGLNPASASSTSTTAFLGSATFGGVGVSSSAGMVGLSGAAQNNWTGTIGSATGVSGYIGAVNGGTITNAYAGSFQVAQTASTITNGYGVYIGPVAGTNAWGLFSASSVPSYFGGSIGIGTTTPAVSLDMSAKTDAIALPKGTTAQEPGSAVAGWIRYNTSNNAVEFYNGSTWTTLTSGGSGSYLSSSGGTVSGAVTISSGGLNVTGGIAANSGSITGVGSNITGSGSMTVAAGGTAQSLTLSSSTSGSVNVGSGNGTSLSVLDGGASTVDYVTVKGSATGGSPTIGTAGTDTNINLTIAPKGTGNTIISSGNVGIGTASPGSPLDVESSVAATSGGKFSSVSYLYAKPLSASSATFQAANSSTYVQSGSSNITGEASGFAAWAENDSAATVSYSKGLYAGVSNHAGGTVTNAYGLMGEVFNGSTGTITNGYGLNVDVNQSAGTITNAYGIYVGPVQGTNKWSFYANDSTAPSYFAGYVGVGTTTPSDYLTIDVNGGTANGLRIRNASSGSSDVVQLISRSNTGLLQLGDTAGTINAMIDTRVGNNTFFARQSTQRLGVGTNAPNFKLESSGSVASGYFGLTNSTAGDIMTVNGSGNVGIGTTAPATSLDLSSKTDAIALPKGTTVQEPSSAASGWLRYNTTNNALEFYNGSSWITVTSGGSGSYLSSSGGTVSGGVTISSGGLSVTGGINANSGSITNVGSITGTGAMVLTPTNTATSGSTSADGFIVTYNPASNPASGTNLNAVANQVTTAGTSSLVNAALTAAFNSTVHNTTTTLGTGIGGYNQTANNATGTITSAFGSINRVSNNTTGTVSAAYGAYADVVNASGTVTTGYGLYTGTIQATTKYSVYASDATAPSYFAGNVGIGTSSPGYRLDVNGVVNASLSGGYSIGGTTVLTVPSGSTSSVGIGGAVNSAATGGNNYGFGSGALASVTTGVLNLALGNASLQSNTTGSNNVAVGPGAVQSATGASYNTGVGYQALLVATTGYADTVVGFWAGKNVSTGYYNAIFGANAGNVLTTGNNNTILGYGAGSSTLSTGSGNILLGANTVDTPAASTSNFLNIGNTIFATNVNTGTVAAPAGSVGIGTTSPATTLDVAGTTGTNASVEGTSSYVSSGAAYSIPDATLNIRRVTLSADATITLPTFTAPSAKVWTLTVMVKQDATGSHALTFAGSGSDTILWDQASSTPQPQTTANTVTIYQFTKPSDETTWYASQVWKHN